MQEAKIGDHLAFVYDFNSGTVEKSEETPSYESTMEKAKKLEDLERRRSSCHKDDRLEACTKEVFVVKVEARVATVMTKSVEVDDGGWTKKRSFPKEVSHDPGAMAFSL